MKLVHVWSEVVVECTGFSAQGIYRGDIISRQYTLKTTIYGDKQRYTAPGGIVSIIDIRDTGTFLQ